MRCCLPFLFFFLSVLDPRLSAAFVKVLTFLLRIFCSFHLTFINWCPLVWLAEANCCAKSNVIWLQLVLVLMSVLDTWPIVTEMLPDALMLSRIVSRCVYVHMDRGVSEYKHSNTYIVILSYFRLMKINAFWLSLWGTILFYLKRTVLCHPWQKFIDPEIVHWREGDWCYMTRSCEVSKMKCANVAYCCHRSRCVSC